MTTIRKDFYDIDLNFQPTLSHDVGSIVSDEAINIGILNELYVRPGEKLFVPSFGLGIELYLFDIDKEDAINRIKSTLNSYLNGNNPRIRSGVAEGSIAGQNTILFDITYIRADTGTLAVFKLFMEIIKSSQGIK